MASFLDLNTGLPALWAKVKTLVAESGDVYYFELKYSASTGYYADVTFDTVRAEFDSGKVVCATRSPYVYYLVQVNAYGMGFVRYFGSTQFIEYFSWDKTSNTFTRYTTTVLNSVISSPTNGQVLTYDGTTSNWVNSTPNQGVTYSLSISNNVITLTGSDSSTSSITLPVYNGGVSS